MKTILFSIILTIVSTSLAQETVSKPLAPKHPNLTFGWIYSPEVSYRFLSEGKETDETTLTEINDRDANERTKFGQSFGFFWGYKLSKLFTLEGGFGYTDFGQGENPTPLYLDPFSQEEFGTIATSHHIHFVSLPISLQVNLGGKRIQGFISGGIAPGFISRYTSYTSYKFNSGSTSTSNSYSVEAQKGFTDFVLGAHISGGIHYHYNAKTSLRIAPVFRITTNNVYSPGTIRGNFFNAGIEFGTVYKL